MCVLYHSLARLQDIFPKIFGNYANFSGVDTVESHTCLKIATATLSDELARVLENACLGVEDEGLFVFHVYIIPYPSEIASTFSVLFFSQRRIPRFGSHAVERNGHYIRRTHAFL